MAETCELNIINLTTDVLINATVLHVWQRKMNLYFYYKNTQLNVCYQETANGDVTVRYSAFQSDLVRPSGCW